MQVGSRNKEVPQHDDIELEEQLDHTNSSKDAKVQNMDDTRRIDTVSTSFREEKQNVKDHSPQLDGQQFYTQMMPKRVVALTIGLTVFGVLFTILGLYDLIASTDFQRGVALLVLGIIMLIPGGYYSIHLYYFYKATSPQEQQQILNEFPID